MNGKFWTYAAFAILLSASAGAWGVRAELSEIKGTLKAMEKRMDGFDSRLLYLERNGAQWGGGR